MRDFGNLRAESLAHDHHNSGFKPAYSQGYRGFESPPLRHTFDEVHYEWTSSRGRIPPTVSPYRRKRRHHRSTWVREALIHSEAGHRRRLSDTALCPGIACRRPLVSRDKPSPTVALRDDKRLPPPKKPDATG